MADDLPPDLAARYPSIANGGKAPARAAATAPPAPGPAPAQQSTATAEERLAKRYPSLGNGGQAVKSDRPASGRGAPIEPAAAPAPEEKTLTPAEHLEREQLRLAKRYGSMPNLAKPAELQAPEGYDPADPDFIEFRKVAGELGLDKGKAGRMLELHQRVLASQEAVREKESEAWRAQTEADSEIMAGAESAKQLVKAFGGKDLVEALGSLGNHPTVVRSFVRIAKALEEARGGRW